MHNAAATVAATLHSLQQQTEPAWEAIVIDDGSTDRGAAAVRAFAAADPRITFRQQPRAGAAAARNLGLNLARGEWVAFLDADDWLDPDAYATLLAAAHTGSADAVRGLCRHSDAHGRTLHWPHPPSPVHADAGLGLRELLSGEVFAIHAQLIRRSAIGQTRFRTHLDCFEDLDFFLHLAERGLRWTPVQRVVCTYRQRPVHRGTPAFAAKFRTIRAVYTDCFARLARLPNPPLDLDTSPDALNHLLFRRAVSFAHLMVLQDTSPEKDLAASILAGFDRSLRISPEAAAHAAHGYLPWSECRDITAWPHHLDRYAEALGAWWQRCIADGRADADLIDRALPLLARRLANELDIPLRILRHLDPNRPIVVLGAGRNGQRMARALAARALCFQVRDDRADAREEITLQSGGRAESVANGQPLPPGAQCIMTLLDDAAYIATLPPGVTCVRWADYVDTDARILADQLRSSLHQPC